MVSRLRIRFLAWRLRQLVKWREFQIRLIEKCIHKLLAYHDVLVMAQVVGSTPERYERPDEERYYRESNR